MKSKAGLQSNTTGFSISQTATLNEFISGIYADFLIFFDLQINRKFSEEFSVNKFSLKNIKQKFGYIAIALWAIPLSFILSLMMGLHLSPHPKDQLRGLASENEINVQHFLSLKCSCSLRLIDHLLNRKASKEISETVHLIHAEDKVTEKLRQAGYKVEPITEEASVQKFNLQALPLLVVAQKDQILYQGGYAHDQQHTQAYEDQKIINDLLQKKKVSEFAVLGCANGSLRKKLVDPIGVKYERN